MEYLYYLFSVAAVIGLVLYLLRSGAADLPQPRRTAPPAKFDETKTAAVLKRGLREVPTPWGWPGSTGRPEYVRSQGARNRPTGGSSGLSSWVDRLIAEKRTVDDDDYLLRKDASLRALLEDRFGRSVKPGEVMYRQVSVPRLRDPNRPHDQMDNFPSGKTEQIVARLQSEPISTAAGRLILARRSGKPLGEVKTPWGW